nr:transposase [Clostridium frigidicarnis]
MRKSYNGEFKATVVIQILKEEKSIAQIASEHDIYLN